MKMKTMFLALAAMVFAGAVSHAEIGINKRGEYAGEFHYELYADFRAYLGMPGREGQWSSTLRLGSDCKVTYASPTQVNIAIPLNRGCAISEGENEWKDGRWKLRRSKIYALWPR